MGDPKTSGCPPDLPSLKNPEWLQKKIADSPNRPDLHVKYAFEYAERVERERVERLDRLSRTTAPIRAQIAAQAMKHREKKDWMLKVMRPYEGPFGVEFYRPGDNKCNLFVFEMLKGAGAPVEMQEHRDLMGLGNWHPPLAGQWANRDFCIPGFEVLKVPPDVPQPGDVAAIAHDSEDATGHVGIVVGPPDSPPQMTVSNRFDGVVHNKWGFKDVKGEVVFRRYVGGAEHAAPPAPPKVWQQWLKG